MSFIVYALPRSRTFWLSKFLTYGDWQCTHDETLHLRSLEDIHSWFIQPNVGSVETAASPYWRLVQEYQPDIKTVVIRRPVDEVLESLAKQGYAQSDAMKKSIWHLDRKLDQITYRVPNVLSVSYDELQSEDACRRIFEHCLPYQHDTDWWQGMSDINLQVNLGHQLKYYLAHQKQLTKVARIAEHQIRKLISRNTQESDRDDGITMREDTFDEWYRDTKDTTLADHLVLIGETPHNQKNWTLWRELNRTGDLQIISARSNGKVFGYLMTMMAPSMEEEDRKTGVLCAFYASPLFKGLGLKLQRHSLNVLRDKGVNDAYFYAGVRGDGPRLGSMYKRLGATNHGQIYKMTLSD